MERVRNPYGNPGIGGAPYHRLEGGVIAEQAFGGANAMLQQVVGTGLLGYGGFERAARALAQAAMSDNKEDETPQPNRPLRIPWGVWSVKPYSDVRVVEY